MIRDFDTDEALHSADVESVARRLVEVACAQTGSRNGAVFLYDAKEKGLSVDFHMVEGVIVTLPGTGEVLRPRRDGRPNGIAVGIHTPTLIPVSPLLPRARTASCRRDGSRSCRA